MNTANDIDNLKDSIDGPRILSDIDSINDELQTMSDVLLTAKNTSARPTRVADLIIKTNARRNVLTDRRTILFAKLNKILPDVRQTNLGNTKGGDLFESFKEAMMIGAKRNTL